MTAPNPWTTRRGGGAAWPPPHFRKRFALALLACVLVMAAGLVEKVTIWQGTETTVATVVPLRKANGEPVTRGEDLPAWLPVPLFTLRFETRDGVVVEAENASLRQWPSEGARIPIRYDPRAPARSVVQGSNWDLLVQAIGILGFGWVLIPPLWRAMWGGLLRFWPLWPWRG